MMSPCGGIQYSRNSRWLTSPRQQPGSQASGANGPVAAGLAGAAPGAAPAGEAGAAAAGGATVAGAAGAAASVDCAAAPAARRSPITTTGASSIGRTA